MHKWGLSIEVDHGSMCPIALDMVGAGIRIDYYPPGYQTWLANHAKPIRGNISVLWLHPTSGVVCLLLQSIYKNAANHRVYTDLFPWNVWICPAIACLKHLLFNHHVPEKKTYISIYFMCIRFYKMIPYHNVGCVLHMSHSILWHVHEIVVGVRPFKVVKAQCMAT